MTRRRWRLLVSTILVFAVALTARVRSYSYVATAAAEELSSGYCTTTVTRSYCGEESYCKVAGLLGCLEIGFRSVYYPPPPPLCPYFGPTPCSDLGPNCDLGWCEEADHEI